MDTFLFAGVYLTVVMGITSVSIVMTVVVLNFHYCSPLNKRDLPQWLKRIIRRHSLIDDFGCDQAAAFNTSHLFGKYQQRHSSNSTADNVFQKATEEAETKYPDESGVGNVYYCRTSEHSYRMYNRNPSTQTDSSVLKVSEQYSIP